MVFKQKYLLTFSLVFFLLNLISCKEKTPQSEIDETIIKNYVSDNNLAASLTGTGLYYIVDASGTGLKPNSTSTVTVAYKGYLTDGNVFDESSAEGITFALSNVIAGWQEGIPLFKEGGKGKLLIPSALGYGSQGSGEIPKNAVIIFDVELIEVL
jgi:FKBP-type peptidyl-prolyl cis-trans isomerase FkpA